MKDILKCVLDKKTLRENLKNKNDSLTLAAARWDDVTKRVAAFGELSGRVVVLAGRARVVDGMGGGMGSRVGKDCLEHARMTTREVL